MASRLPLAAFLMLALATGAGAAPLSPPAAPPAAPLVAGEPACCAFPWDDIEKALGAKIWAAPDGKQEGPFKPSEVFDLVRSGRITPSTLVFAAPLKTWTKAGDVPILAAHFEAVRRLAEAEKPSPPVIKPEADLGPPGPPPVDPPPVQESERVSLPPGMDETRLRAVSQRERQDFGIQAIATLHTGAPHAPTPLSIPGARLIDTLNLAALLGQQPPVPVVLLDALGGEQRLPNAIAASWASTGQSFEDAVQTRLGQGMQSVAGGNLDVPVVTYCYDPHCWMSYNVALRLARLGYRNVFWYRGGIAAWEEAGLPTQPQPMQ